MLGDLRAMNLADGLGDNYFNKPTLEAALADDSSVFYTYQKLIALRKQEAILTWGKLPWILLPKQPCIVVLSP